MQQETARATRTSLGSGMKPKIRALAAELNAQPGLFQFKANITYLIKSKAQKYHILHNQHKKNEENNDLWIINSI